MSQRFWRNTTTTLKFLAKHNYNIEESSQFEDRQEKRFFMRTELAAVNDQATALENLKSEFSILTQSDPMQWQISHLTDRPKVVLAV